MPGAEQGGRPSSWHGLRAAPQGRGRGAHGGTFARNGESVDCCAVYEQQLLHWQAGRLTVAQRREVARVLDATRELRQVHTRIVELADELGRATIERQLAKSDIELGLEYMLGLQRF